MKLDLLTNATVVDDAIRFVSHSTESKEPDYNGDNGLVEQEKFGMPTNQVF
jgi:hypothetical protein